MSTTSGPSRYSEFGEFLRKARLATPLPDGRPMSLRAAGASSGVHFANLQKFETGRYCPSPTQAFQLARAYNMEPLLVLRRLGYLPLPGFLSQPSVVEPATASAEQLNSALEEFLSTASVDAKRRLLSMAIALELAEQLLSRAR